jgi:hypothetical protein
MTLLKSAAVIVALGASSLALAGSEPVNITSPADGAKVQSSGTQVAYEAAAAPNAHHAVVTLDGAQAAELKDMKGVYTLTKLSLGEHTVCVRVVDSQQALTEAEKCIRVTAANPELWTY